MTSKRNSEPYIPNAGDYLIASKNSELMSLQYFLQMGKLIQCISNLVHGLQRERGASNIFLGSSGSKFIDERQAIMVDSDQLRQAFELSLAEVHKDLTGAPVSGQLLNQIASALHCLESLEELRGRVAAQTLTAESATSAYSSLIQNLIAVVFEAADIAVDPTIAGLLVAMVHIMNGKELCGQERAAGSSGFSSGSFDAALSQRIAHLVESQERCFQVFKDFADPDSLSLWQELCTHDREEELKRLRGLVSSVAPFKDLDPDLTDHWFRLMSERIDALKEVEDSVEGCFHARCIERFADARQSLADQETLISSFDNEGKTSHPVLVLCDSGDYETPTGSFSGSGVSQQFGRSIFELVQEQTRRLQQMNHELQSAREALEDRKTQEKAMLLLMEHRKISNDEAHRLLRKLAMDQGKKLSDVARSVIAMTGARKS